MVLPDNGEAWQKLRSDDFTDVDLSHVSDRFVEMLFSMLDSNPDGRPAIEEIYWHPVMRIVRERMARGVMNSELDQLPDFELPTIESGPLIGQEEHDMDMDDDLLRPVRSAPSIALSPDADQQHLKSSSSRKKCRGPFHQQPEDNDSTPRKVLDVRGALISEVEEEFMRDILGYQEDSMLLSTIHDHEHEHDYNAVHDASSPSPRDTHLNTPMDFAMME